MQIMHSILVHRFFKTYHMSEILFGRDAV
jgi:hypothetical protein